MNKSIRIAFAGTLLGAAVASQAFTMATFADPAIDGSTPLFSLTGSSITGGWSGTGLLLQTPGWAAPDYADAKFTMAPVALTPVAPGFWNAGNGQIDFTDSSNNLVLRITFDSGFVSVNGAGASDLFSNNVVFSGPGVPVVTDETFNFSFANFQPNANGVTATAAFTSSAVPEPASIAAIGLGLAAVIRRRRKR
ncbi:MAG: PEP-CTERM sorting domain-containing protein [Fimbriimonadaceae bacterium]|nr:PEP-CTERM sorting domain-containing protein [Fimbriimonadaceae bacterium]